MLSLLSACNSETGQQSSSQNKEVNQQVFLIGNGTNLKETITDLVEKSGIRKGGYVVIIPTTFQPNDKNANLLRKGLNDQDIMAVHILPLLAETKNASSSFAIKNSDVLAIENARIICILNGNNNLFMRLANQTRLTKSIQKAKTKGTLIAGMGNAASIFGDHYYTMVKDTTLQKNKAVLRNGLRLLKNTVVDDITLLKNNWKRVRQDTKKKNFTFIGMGKNSSVWIKNSDAVVLSKNKISIMPPDTTAQRLGDGDEFRLLPQ